MCISKLKFARDLANGASERRLRRLWSQARRGMKRPANGVTVNQDKKKIKSRDNRDFANAVFFPFNGSARTYHRRRLDVKTKSRKMARARPLFPSSESPNAARPSVWPPTVPQKRRSILIALVRPIFRHRRFDVTYASYGITRELTAKNRGRLGPGRIENFFPIGL